MTGRARSTGQTDSAETPLEASVQRGPSLILWDLVGSCNLKCPSCPVGTMPGTNPKGLITPELFEKVIAKLASEFPCRQLHFYNWTEPLIHPLINGFCAAAASRGFHLHVSSNLNYLKSAPDLLSTGIKAIRVSLSGFSQSIYEIGHRGGNVEKVKRNMRLLSQAKSQTGSLTRLHVYYHKYRHNLHELPLMEQFARELGFDFIADWAFLMPLEKLLASQRGELTGEEQQFATDCIVPSTCDSLSVVQSDRHLPCELIDQLVIDFQGNVTLCCAVYASATHLIGNYLDCAWEEIQRRKYRHAKCTECMRAGAHVFYTHFSKPHLRERMSALAERALERGPSDVGSIRLPILQASTLLESA